jgi:hypothetical protein
MRGIKQFEVLSDTMGGKMILALKDDGKLLIGKIDLTNNGTTWKATWIPIEEDPIPKEKLQIYAAPSRPGEEDIER